MEKKIYRTVIRFEILSEEPIETNNLERIADECNEGSWSGQFLDEEISNEELIGKSAIEKIKAQGSSPEFFNLDEHGNEIQ